MGVVFLYFLLLRIQVICYVSCFIAYEYVMDNSTDNVINKVLKASVKADIACYHGKLVYIFIFKNKIICPLNDNCLLIDKKCL